MAETGIAGRLTRTRELAENLMLRQSPGEVNEATAKRVVDAAAEFYRHFETLVENEVAAATRGSQ